MLKFKEGVKGFVFDQWSDEITKVFNKVLSAEESISINEVIGEYTYLFEDEEVVMRVFDNVDCEEELGVLAEVMDWVE